MPKPKFTTVRGVHDSLPESFYTWRHIENVARNMFSLFNYQEINIPIFEQTSLFQRGIGTETDIVSKEMYTFDDKGGDSITLRPEATASICRAYVQHALYNKQKLNKLFFIGPMFRYERPQSGRLRQFHQIDAEAIGSKDPAIDAEMITMLMNFLKSLGLKDLHLQINNLGDLESRKSYSKELEVFLLDKGNSLDSEIKDRIKKNPFRFLDSKDPKHQELIELAPTNESFLDTDSLEHMESVKSYLDSSNIPFSYNKRLVRGLDYYCFTVFEITSENLGAQNAVCGGGRYDKLIEELGGPETPAIGFAIGIERLLQLVSESTIEESSHSKNPEIYIISLGKEPMSLSFQISNQLRESGIRTELSFDGGSMKSQMKKANRSSARFTLIIGEDELLSNSATLKNMSDSSQEEINLKEIKDVIKEKIQN
ncbi:MAG: histidine--tRNA ligase [bacterium]